MGSPTLDLPFTQASFDRSDDLRTKDQVLHDAWNQPTTAFVVVADSQVLINSDQQPFSAVHSRAELEAAGWQLPDDPFGEGTLFLGAGSDGASVFGLWGDEQPTPTASSWQSLRHAAVHLPGSHAGWAATTSAMSYWSLRHQRCGQCGAPVIVRNGGWLRVCTKDNSEHYPRTDAAVITSVLDDADRMLLVRGAGWPPDRMSVVAGFVEPGESLEQAVRREVLEETGVYVGQVQYRASQPWPFPGSLMVGFHSRAETTALSVDNKELADAAWFSRDDYRKAIDEGRLSPGGPLSVSQRLITDWLDDSL